MCIVELTGESSPSPDLLRKADILCTTPEKWDGTSRQVNSYFADICTPSYSLLSVACPSVREADPISHFGRNSFIGARSWPDIGGHCVSYAVHIDSDRNSSPNNWFSLFIFLSLHIHSHDFLVV
jgi:hypothetical protein